MNKINLLLPMIISQFIYLEAELDSTFIGVAAGLCLGYMAGVVTVKIYFLQKYS